MHVTHLKRPAARFCQLCGKEPVSGQNKSHSQRKTKRTIRPNLQRFGQGFVCTRCLKTLERALA
ncbi:MAG: large ribosomal subunit protein bL28 [Patescibacteria group bacterium]|jgi:ribosomal protein L28